MSEFTLHAFTAFLVTILVIGLVQFCVGAAWNMLVAAFRVDHWSYRLGTLGFYTSMFAGLTLIAVAMLR